MRCSTNARTAHRQTRYTDVFHAVHGGMTPFRFDSLLTVVMKFLPLSGVNHANYANTTSHTDWGVREATWKGNGELPKSSSLPRAACPRRDREKLRSADAERADKAVRDQAGRA